MPHCRLSITLNNFFERERLLFPTQGKHVLTQRLEWEGYDDEQALPDVLRLERKMKYVFA